MNKKISDLVATAPVVTAALTDQYECVQGGVSKGGTWQKIVNLIGSLNPLSLTSIDVSGAGSFGGGQVQLNADGSAVFVGKVTSNGADLGVGILTGADWSIAADGSASLANGGFAIASDGSFVSGGSGQVVSFNVGGGNIFLNSDGSASFGGGNATIDAFGAATFAGGAASINGSGEIQSPSYYVGPDQGVTQDVSVLTALPSTFTVLHFSGGILIGTTP